MSVATLCNLATTNPSQLARRVADVYLGDKMLAAADAGSATAQGRPTPPPSTWTPTATELAAFAGSYFSPELETTYKLSVKNGKLVLSRRRAPRTELVPTAPDSFTLRGVQFHFTRDKRSITGFTIDAGRTRNLRFERQK